jgi:hypothetical protein
LDRVGYPVDGLILAEDGFLDVFAKRLEPLPFIADNGFRRNFRHSGDRVLDHVHRYFFRPFARGQKLYGCSDLIDHVNRLVGQKPVIYVLSGKFGSCSQRFVAIFDAVMLFVKFLQAF